MAPLNAPRLRRLVAYLGVRTPTAQEARAIGGDGTAGYPRGLGTYARAQPSFSLGWPGVLRPLRRLRLSLSAWASRSFRASWAVGFAGILGLGGFIGMDAAN